MALIGIRAGKILYEQREIGRNDLPDDVVVDIVVAVNEPVSQADYLQPRNSGSPRLLVSRYTRSCFADDLE